MQGLAGPWTGAGVALQVLGAFRSGANIGLLPPAPLYEAVLPHSKADHATCLPACLCVVAGDYEDVEDEVDRLKDVLKKASKNRETLEAMMDHYMKECVSLKRGRAFYDLVERYKRLRIKSLKHELKRLKQWLEDYDSNGRPRKDEL